MTSERLHDNEALRDQVRAKFKCEIETDSSGAIVDFLDDQGRRLISIRVFDETKTFRILSKTPQYMKLSREGIALVNYRLGVFAGLFHLVIRK